ncbi:MAG: hypothetical protein K1X44_05820 [Alphaproteobacteria bacterium]|nr:hypothetical protein [Alphaproteobacteria bacterium]
MLKKIIVLSVLLISSIGMTACQKVYGPTKTTVDGDQYIPVGQLPDGTYFGGTHGVMADHDGKRAETFKELDKAPEAPEARN